MDMNLNDFPNNSYVGNSLPDLIADSAQARAPAQKLEVPRRSGTSMLHSSDGVLVSHIVSNYSSSAPVEHIPNRNDLPTTASSNQFFPINNTADNNFYHKNILQNTNSNLASTGYQQPSTGSFTSEMIASNSRNPALCKGNPNRAVSRPIQKVAPQPRNPVSEARVSDTPLNPVGDGLNSIYLQQVMTEERPNLDERVRDSVDDYTAISNPQEPHNPDPESLKIKLRKFPKKKTHKARERNTSSKSPGYNVVSSEEGGHIKLKISCKQDDSEKNLDIGDLKDPSKGHLEKMPASHGDQGLKKSEKKRKKSKSKIKEYTGDNPHQFPPLEGSTQAVFIAKHDSTHDKHPSLPRQPMSAPKMVENTSKNQQMTNSCGSNDHRVHDNQNAQPIDTSTLLGYRTKSEKTTFQPTSSVRSEMFATQLPYQQQQQQARLLNTWNNEQQQTFVMPQTPAPYTSEPPPYTDSMLTQLSTSEAVKPSNLLRNQQQQFADPKSQLTFHSDQQFQKPHPHHQTQQFLPLRAQHMQIRKTELRPQAVAKQPYQHHHGDMQMMANNQSNLYQQQTMVRNARQHLDINYQQRATVARTTSTQVYPQSYPQKGLAVHPMHQKPPHNDVIHQIPKQQQQQMYTDHHGNHSNDPSKIYDRGFDFSNQQAGVVYNNQINQKILEVPRNHQVYRNEVSSNFPPSTFQPTQYIHTSRNIAPNTLQQANMLPAEMTLSINQRSSEEQIKQQPNWNLQTLHNSSSKMASELIGPASKPTSADKSMKGIESQSSVKFPATEACHVVDASASFKPKPQASYNSSSPPSNRKKEPQCVRVKFLADSEEADIYKLKDIMFRDDREVVDFDELTPGTQVVAKWPGNGRMYDAYVINPLDSARRFRTRRPPPKPFQANAAGVTRFDSDETEFAMKRGDGASGGDGFHAYRTLADRIKYKKRERRRGDEKRGKKRKTSTSLIEVASEEGSDDESYQPVAKKPSRLEEAKKMERRSAVESRFQQHDGIGAFNRFIALIRKIFEKIDLIDPKLLNEIMSSEFEELPKVLISRNRLEELNEEAIKLKNLSSLNKVPRSNLTRLLTYLVPIIRDGINLKPLQSEGKSHQDQRSNRDSKFERVYCATEAALVALTVMTSPLMSKAVYIDEVMERAAQLLRHQLNHTIYPEYDPVYRITHSGKKKDTLQHSSSRMKRAHFKGTKDRRVLCLYNKLNLLLSGWVELVNIQPLTDTTILQVSPVGISPFFVENVKELQLSAIRLTTNIFSRYESHRKHILDEIFESMARLPTSKRNLRSYRLNYAEETLESSDEDEDFGGCSGRKKDNLQYIQMVSALILQMIQAIIQLPSPLPTHLLGDEISRMDFDTADEVKIVTSYDMARSTAQKFITAFLKKCSTKNEDIDFRPLFENFLHDLLNTVNKPEWPASEMVLTAIGRLLVITFSNKSSEMPLRVASLDYLGVVAAKLRRDALSGRSDVSTVKTLMRRLEDTMAAFEGDADDVPEAPVEVATDSIASDQPLPVKKKSSGVAKSFKQRLQCLVLGYLRYNLQADRSLSFALNYYVGQWVRDVTCELQALSKKEETSSVEERAMNKCRRRKSFLLRLSRAIIISSMSKQERDDVSVSDSVAMVIKQQKRSDQLARALTNDDATQLTRYLASSRPFSQSFDIYLSYILKVCEEPAVALRTRAMKCLAEIVAVDPEIMARDDISQGVRLSLVDGSTNVREAAVDLIGRFIISKPELVNQYYEMLTARILDTGVSVRKRVIRILRDLCHEHPHLPQMTDACVLMIRRVNDEEGIKKLVHEVFMKMWFTPIVDNDRDELKKKALLITDIVAANRNRGYEWIEQLFKNLIDTPVENPKVESACRQIVDCLVDHVILLENDKSSCDVIGDDVTHRTNLDTASKDDHEEDNGATSSARVESSTSQKLRLVATVQTLGYLAKIRPMYLVKHVILLQPYLATKCEVPDDILIVQGVCNILELAVPLMQRPSDTFLNVLESEMMKIVLTHRFRVVPTAVTCLAAIITSFTQNYSLIWDCFERMCNGVNTAVMLCKQDVSKIFSSAFRVRQLCRTLYVIGHLSKTFNFDDEVFKGYVNVCVKDRVYDCVYYFCVMATTRDNEATKICAVTCLGLLMIQDPNMMFRSTTRDLYKDLLAKNQKSIKLKGQVLKNLQDYLKTEDVKQQKAALENVKKHKKLDQRSSLDSVADDLNGDNIKEICDVSSGMSSSVMQLFLKEVLEELFHPSTVIRRASLRTVVLTLQQGLVHPNQCVPYLIASTSDPEPVIYKEADQQLNEISKKYSGFIHSNSNSGINMSYKLHRTITPEGKVVRGFGEVSQLACDESTKCNKAFCCHLYQIVRSDRKHRRSFIASLLRLFDDTVKTDLEKLIFVADNLAYFPYQTVDEPLFLMHEIEVFVSVSGSNVLQSFKETLNKCKLRPKHRAASSSESSSSEEEDSDLEDSEELRGLLRMDEDAIDEFAHHSLACLLLLWLKDYLKSVYGFTDNKIHRYVPTEKNRANDKHCHRRHRLDGRMRVTAAIDHVIRVKKLTPCRSVEFRRAVKKQYIELKELMNKLDPNEEDSSSDEKKVAPSTSVAASSSLLDTSTSSKTQQNNLSLPSNDDNEESDVDTDGEPAKKTTLDIIRHSTALKDRKKLRKSSHRVKYNEGSSSGESDFKGFDN